MERERAGEFTLSDRDHRARETGTDPTASRERAGVPGGSTGEEVTVLLERSGVRIERIVSRGHRSPEGFWYDQAEGEWVTLVAGRARLRLADPDEVVELGPGDWIDLPAHRRHRVEWTDPEQDTVWLVVFYPASD